MQLAAFALVLALSCGFTAQGQEKKFVTAHKVSPKDIPSIPGSDGDLPQIPNTVVTVLPALNGMSVNNVYIATMLGTGNFTVVGNTNDGQRWQLGAWTFEGALQPGESGIVGVQNGDIGTIIFGFPGFASYDVYHQDGGTIQKSTAFTYPGNSLRVKAANISAEKLTVTLGGPFSQNAIASFGFTGTLGTVKPVITGDGVVTFPVDPGIVAGPTSITVCDQGLCQTGTFVVNQAVAISQ